MGILFQDIRYAARFLSKSPFFVVVVTLTLGLGIGANTAVFSFVNGVLLRPLPLPDDDRLVMIYSVHNSQRRRLSVPELDDLNASGIVQAAAGFRASQYNFSARGADPEEVPATIATHKILEVLGVSAACGTVWPEFNDRHRSFIVMLTHDLWVRKFNAKPDIVGSIVTMDGAPYEVAGVLPPNITFPTRAGLFRCWGIAPGYDTREYRSAQVVARLRPGATLEQTQAELAAFGRALSERFPGTNAGVEFALEPLRTAFFGNVEPYLHLMLGMVALVLIIAMANIANLLLSRMLARKHEFALRVALGANKVRIARQLLTETVLLGAVAGGIGVLFASWWVRVLDRQVRAQLPDWLKIDFDWNVLIFLAGVSAIAGLLVGLLPLVRVIRDAPQADLQRRPRGGAISGGKMRAGLVIAEVALAVVVIAGAGITIRAYQRLQAQDYGFEIKQLLTMRVALPWRTYDAARIRAFHPRVLANLQAIPGVENVALNSNLPFFDRTASTREVLPDQNVALQGRRGLLVTQQAVNADYHRAMGIRLVLGRFFAGTDRPDSIPVAIVSESAARLLWENTDVVGRRINLAPRNPQPVWATVVGVVSDVKHNVADSSTNPDVYTLSAQNPSANVAYLIRSHMDPKALTSAAVRAVWQVDPEQSVFDIRTMETRATDSVWEQEIARVLFMLFGILAVALATVGIYAVISHSVTNRLGELGIRKALGAMDREILLLVLRQGCQLAVVGVLIGGVLSFFLSRLLLNVLGNGERDIVVLGVAASIPLILAPLSCILPAMRAAKLDPASALRDG